MADFWDDAKAALAAVAPAIGTAVGGPLGGTAANLLVDALGLPSGTTPQQIASAVTNATPDQLMAMKKADNDFQVSLQQLGVTADQVAAGDRDSARKMEAATKDWVPGTLMMLLTGGFFGLLGYLASHDVPAGNKDLLNVMLGSLGTAWVGGVTYYYGSSKDQARNTELLAKAGPIS